MQQTTQLLKWAIPGWIFIGLFLILLKFDALFTDNNLVDFLKIAEYLDPKSTGFFLLVGTAGLPLGYLIYQIYYFLYWTVLYVFEKDIPWINHLLLYWSPDLILDKEKIIKEMKQHGLDSIMNHEIDNSLILKVFKKGKINNVIKDMITNYYYWVFLKKKWNEKYKLQYERELLVNRMNLLNDIYDSLGAAFLAIFLSSSIVPLIVFLKVPFDSSSNTSFSTSALWLPLNLFSFLLLRSNRIHIKRNIFILYRYMFNIDIKP